MYQSQAEAKAFTIAYRARFEPEVHFRSYFTRCASARFWKAVESSYNKLVAHGDWYEAETIKVGQLFNVLHKFLRVADQSPNRHHTRGDYLRYACGVSHGGGQKVRGVVGGETVPC